MIDLKPDQLKLGRFTGQIMNGNRVIVEITFHIPGTWSAAIHGKNINLQNIGLDNEFKQSKLGILKVIDTVKKFKYCQGINKVSNSNENLYIKYICSQAGDENSGKTLYKSHKCGIVVSYVGNGNICHACINLNAQCDETTGTSDCEDVDQESSVMLNECDHTDFSAILDNIFPSCTDKMKLFFTAQRDALKAKPKGRRWNKDVIRTCLTIWCRSPRAYVELKSSGFFILPSTRILQYYKNSVNQVSGFNKELLHWMLNEAQRNDLSPDGYEGGIIIDEMTIQSDIQFSKKGGGISLIGFNSVTPESSYIDRLTSQKEEINLATHSLQLLFLGNTGYRFPFAHFATTGASGSELYLLLWEAVKHLEMFGFKVTFVSTDGAQANRDLMNILLPNNKDDKSFTFLNIMQPSQQISFVMDFSHVMKKIRNNINKSGLASYNKRNLLHGENPIHWNHWKSAFSWDISTNPFPVHRKLSNEHMFLTSESKMRNRLAEDVMDADMLHLMEVYQSSLESQEALKLNSTISLLKNTSVLVSVFRDPRPITKITDKRLSDLLEVLKWFQSWETSVLNNKEIKNKEKALISHQTRQDIVSCINGFYEFCALKLKKNGYTINASRFNSDVIENIFSQQRGLHNGCNTNPSYLEYCRTMNTIILGEATVSAKSNTGGKGADPYKFNVPLLPKKGKNNKMLKVTIKQYTCTINKVSMLFIFSLCIR